MADAINLAGVIGYPIGHSRSPLLHGHWLRRYGIKGQYVALEVAPTDLEIALPLLPKLGFRGVNVTLPHKERVLALADRITPLAKRIGAANMLTFSSEGIEADNTDAYGFTWNILRSFPGWKPQRVAVLGAGGASRAVLAALQDCGAREIRLANRNIARAQQLSAEFGPSVSAVSWDERHEMLADCDTLVNSTSLGMTGQPPLEIDLTRLPGGALVTDLVYSPLQTALLVTAEGRGNPVVDGLGMLLHQAVPAFHRWFGIEPAVDDALRNVVLSP